MDILYVFEGNLYVNVTNRCPCNCTFCIRHNTDTVGNSGSLWLQRDPSLEEIIEEFNNYDLLDYNEIVFCGFGEPLEQIDIVLKVCEFIKMNSNITIRLNTNGLADLIHQKPCAHLLKGHIDIVSVSLNAPTAVEYQEVTRSIYGEASFDAMLTFATDCKSYIDQVIFSVVDVITKDQIERCQILADEMDIPLRVRVYSA